jgi:hypothetical protein
MKNAIDLKILQDTPPWDWPLDAGKTFLQFLTDPRASESDRLIAAELAGDYVVINDELAEALMAIVGNANDSDELRTQAVVSFGAVLESAWTSGYDDPDDLPPITERTYRKIQNLLQKMYLEPGLSKEFRRRILEVSVRAPESWHDDAIREAYASGDNEWMLTAVFSMSYVRGFDEQILEALNNTDPEIQYEALDAAGNWALDAAWPHVVGLIENPNTPKALLLSAIEAAGSIRPAEALGLLEDLAESDDEEIAETAQDALMMANAALSEEEEEDEEEQDGEWIN